MDKFCTTNVASATPTEIVNASYFGDDTVMWIIAKLSDNAVIGSALITKNTSTGDLNVFYLGTPVGCSFANSSGSLCFNQTSVSTISVDFYCRNMEF